MKNIKEKIQLIGLGFKMRFNMTKLLFHQLGENRRSFKDNQKDLFTRNKMIKIWHDKPNSGTNGKRFKLFTTIMNQTEDETYNMLSSCTDKEINKMYESTFFNKIDNETVKSVRVYAKNDPNWPFTVPKLDVYCMLGDFVYCTIKKHNKEYHYALNGMAVDELGLTSILDSEFAKEDEEMTKTNGGKKVCMSITDYINKGLELFS